MKTLELIESTAVTVRKNGDKIIKGAQGMREALEREVEALREHVSAARASGTGQG